MNKIILVLLAVLSFYTAVMFAKVAGMSAGESQGVFVFGALVFTGIFVLTFGTLAKHCITWVMRRMKSGRDRRSEDRLVEQGMRWRGL